MRLASAAIGLAVCLPGLAFGHAERPSFFPDGSGSVPEYRTTGPSITVCAPDSAEKIAALPEPSRSDNEALLTGCDESSIQDAVDAAENGTRILLLPGTYTEPESRDVPYPDPACADLFVDEAGPRRIGQSVRQTASYEYELCSPNSNALIAILGDSGDDDRKCDVKCDIQIEGTGPSPEDVVIEGHPDKLNTIKADRADGIYLANFTIQYSDFNNIYVHETDGFVFERIISRWSREYGFLSFTSDHGVYRDNVAYGHGDSGIYPGSGPQTENGEFGIVVERNDLYGNLQGTASSAGDNVLWQDNDIHDNGTGFVTDSFSPGHPGSPEHNGKWVNNRIWNNNDDSYYSAERDEYCKKPAPERDIKIVCPAIQVPIGVGVLIAGGNENLIEDNHIWGHKRYGVMQFFVEAIFRGENNPLKLFDTSHSNVSARNHMGVDPEGNVSPNAIDFFWDEQGRGNCWEGNIAGEGGRIHSDPATLPACPGSAISRPVNVLKHATLVPCALWDSEDLTDPPGCDWFEVPSQSTLRQAVKRYAAPLPQPAPQAPGTLGGPLAWERAPVIVEHPTRPGEHLLIGRLVNRGLLPVRMHGGDLRAVTREGDAVAASAVFAPGYAPVVHLWNRRLAPPSYDLERVGKLLSLGAGRSTPVVVAWKGSATPAALDYGSGRLLLR